MSRTCDVLVLGGGPAGLATAIVLARRGRDVVVLERSRYEKARAGESFAGAIALLLQALGVWDDFLALGPIPFERVQSSWGGPALPTREPVASPFGDGWHVDRVRFDEMLARAATRAGAVVERGVGNYSLHRDGRWRLRRSDGYELSARYLVDATGRGAPGTAAHFGDHAGARRWLRLDRQIAVLGTMTTPSRASGSPLLLEPVEDGWWYSVPQPSGALLAVLITDADLLPARGRSALGAHFLERLAQAPETSARAAGAELATAPFIVRSDSGVLVPDRLRGFRALGDAAMACDPLAGDGVLRALRDALETAPDIERALDEPDADVPDPSAFAARLRSYVELRAHYYRRETRWPDAPFWRRRRAIDWKAAPLTLDPRCVLRADAASVDRRELASVEALIPRSVVRALLDRLKIPGAAHEAMGFLRAQAPLDDRQLLVGLQELVVRGCIVVV